MNVIVSPTSNGTVNDTSVHRVDKDNQDMPKRTVLTITTMTGLVAISTQKEGKLVIIVENVKTLTTFVYLFKNQMV